MRLSWNEIRARAARFAEEWKAAHYEKGESQTFYNEFFEVFGVTRRRVASFEEPVKKLGDERGFIDLFWGSERESDEWAILGCFLDGVNSDEFGVSYGHPLGLQEQVAEVLITAPPVDQHANVPIDRLDHTEAHLGPTVVEDAVQVFDQHRGEFLKRG